MDSREREDRMRTDWDKRAATTEEAMAFIIDRYEGPPEPFYASGAKHWADMKEALVHFGAWQPRLDMVGVEIGCGIGRMTIHTAKEFRQFRAYDISARMISYAPRLPNGLYVAGGANDIAYLKQYADYVLSMLVFQHMPRATFLEYVVESYEALRPGGIFCTQMHYGEEERDDAETLLVRGYTPAWIDAHIDTAQWEILADIAPLMGSELWHWLIMRRR
jgi:SAM-dependent methyltransferase